MLENCRLKISTCPSVCKNMQKFNFIIIVILILR